MVKVFHWRFLAAGNSEAKVVSNPSFMTIKKKQGMNEVNRYSLDPSAATRAAETTKVDRPDTPS